MCAGGLFGMLPRLLPQALRAPAVDEQPQEGPEIDASVLETVVPEVALSTETSP